MRSWLFFLGFSLQRQARARLLVVVSLGLLALVAFLTHVSTRLGGWSAANFPVSYSPSSKRVPLGKVVATYEIAALAPTALGQPGPIAVAWAVRAAMNEGMASRVFIRNVLTALLASFLMPLWTLTFGAESLGRARESGTLTWFLLRPLPRWSMYMAAYLAALPGALLLNLGGYVLFCLLGGAAGRQSLPLFALPIFLGTLAFTAFFQLLSVTFRRAAILGLTYAFFFETIASHLPGQQKRLSMSYYVRCLIVDRAEAAGLPLDLPGSRPPVSGTTAIVVLIVATIVFLAIGCFIFSRKQYVESGAA